MVSDEVLELAIANEPETIKGFTVNGAKELVGQTFQRDILPINALGGKGTGNIKDLLSSFKAEAIMNGAKTLRIVGHEIQNATFFRNAGLAGRLGYDFRKIDSSKFEMLKTLP